MLRLLNQGRGLSPFSQGENNDAQLSAQTCTLRIRQRHGFDFSIEFSTSPLRALAILTLSDFHEVSRAGRPYKRSPDQLGLDELRTYQAFLLKTRKLAVGSVVNHVAALRFFFVRTLKRSEFRDFLPYPKERDRLPSILSFG